ncbi:glycerophosphodiester phosphodiesterase [Streptomyces hebeiensis]
MTEAREHRIQVVAHRGASEDAPEHTLAAYMKAIEDGADALECDVRLTADGHLVCVHDRRVNRTSNGRGAVSALELSDLAALDFGSWRDSEESPDWRDPGFTSVLTLERLLELVVDAGRPVQLAIETKHPTRWAGQVEERLLQLLRRFGLDEPGRGTGPAPTPARATPPTHGPGTDVGGGPGAEVVPGPDVVAGPDGVRGANEVGQAESTVRIMSFSARSLHRISSAAPRLPTVYLMQFVSPLLRDGRLPAGARIAGPGIRVVRNHPGYVERLHRAGHRVHVWTVNEPEDVDLCVRLGVEAIITNRPRQVLSRLGRLP